jgi:GntR family transcriptional regulator/MocR family aminotransferase
VAETGSGTRVADRVAESVSRSHTTSRTTEIGPSNPAAPEVDVDFEYGVPDLHSTPMADWMWALREAARTAPSAVTGDEVDAGTMRLREVVAAYHRRVRAGSAEAEQVVVVGGFRQGLVLALSALRQAGVERVGLEDLRPREHDEIVRRAALDPTR